MLLLLLRVIGERGPTTQLSRCAVLASLHPRLIVWEALEEYGMSNMVALVSGKVAKPADAVKAEAFRLLGVSTCSSLLPLRGGTLGGDFTEFNITGGDGGTSRFFSE